MRGVWKITGATVALATLLGAGYAGQEKEAADDQGHKLLVKVCGSCHKLDLVTSRRGTRDEWRATIEAMVDKGADASDDDFNAVLDYLTKNYGPDKPGGISASPNAKLNVNKAAAQDIAGFLNLPEAQGTAIVHYRESNGNFKSWQDVAKTPGVDAAKIEAKKDRLEF